MSELQKAVSFREIIKEELRRCGVDPVYFSKKYCYIQHPVRGKILFNLFPFQEDVIQSIHANDKVIILKSRQIGISTLVAMYTLWLMMFNSDKTILIVATKQEVAKNLVTKIRYMYENLPSWIKTICDGETEDNKLSLRLGNGSSVKATTSTSDTGRSEALSLLVIDEAAFIPDERVKKLWGATQQTIATGGKAVLLSTPNGTGNFYHQTWTEAEAGQNNFTTVKLPWYVHPERDEAWRSKQDAELGPRMAAQECDCDFSTSGNTVVSPEILKWYEESKVKNPMEKRGVDNSYWVWESPDYAKSYILCADVARGDGSDSSTFHVLEAESLTQVAEYRAKIGTTDFGNILVSVATEWNDALLVVDNTGLGWSVIQTIISRGYKNLYYSSRESSMLIDPLMHIQRGHDLSGNMVPGFITSGKVRPLMIGKLEEYMRNREVNVQSKRTIDELKVFVYKGFRPEAAQGYNDDLVMALAEGLWVRDTALYARKVGIDLQKSLIDSINHVMVYKSDDTKELAAQSWQEKIGPETFDYRELLR